MIAVPETLASIGLSFLFVFLALPYWVRRSKQHGLVITDAQKVPARKVPYLAGLVVVFGAVMGVLGYVATQTFVYGLNGSTVVLLAGVATVLVALIVGVIDDLLGEKIGLRQYQKPFLTVLAAVPLVVVNAGQSVMAVPFWGRVKLGLLYPFAVVPVGVLGATNGFNILAGVNGLEAGMGIIILSTLGYAAWSSGAYAAAVIALCVVAALLPFFWYNKFPARVLPGNGLTYAVGAAIAVVAIVGNVERTAVLLFIPYVVEGFLKLRGRFQKESLALPLKSGGLKNKYRKWYSLNHVAISLLRTVKGKAREWEVTALLLGIEVLVAGVALALYLW